MGIKPQDRDIFLNTDLQSAYRIVKKACNKVGKIKEENEMLNSLFVKIKYGIEPVKIRMNLRPQENGTLLSMSAVGQDIWGAGARKGMDKFLKTLNKMISS